MTVVEEPPQDPDDWSEEQWREWLATAPADPDTGRAHPLTRLTRTSGGVVLGAVMSGIDQALFGERPKAEIVAEADGECLDGGDLKLDLDEPARSRIELPGDG